MNRIGWFELFEMTAICLRLGDPRKPLGYVVRAAIASVVHETSDRLSCEDSRRVQVSSET